MNRSVDAPGKTRDSRHPASGVERELVGKHSPRCARQKHEDWQHGILGCSVGSSEYDHCDCTVHWAEKPRAAGTLQGGLGE